MHVCMYVVIVLALKIVVPNSLRNPLWLCELQKGEINMYVCTVRMLLKIIVTDVCMHI